MATVKLFLLCVFVGSIGAEHLKDLSKRMYIGTAMDFLYMNDSLYNKMTDEEFNLISPGWELKWAHVEPQQGQFTYQEADAVVAFAEKHKKLIRGHCLIWHEEVPNWVYQLDKESLRKAIRTRITNEMTRYKGKIYAWDVVNEVFEWNGTIRTNSPFYKNFGESYISDAFILARKTDPNAKLYINDYNIESMNGKSNDVYNLVKKFKATGIPIDGVGFQSHFITGMVPKEFPQVLKRFVDLGVEVAVTELDIQIPNLPASKVELEQQAKDYAFVYKSCQDLPKCVGVAVWPWLDKYSYTKTEADLWDVNYKPKPAVKAVQDVLKGGK